MKIEHETISFCPTCYKEIPALITVEKSVMMEKFCTEHGPFKAMVERDPLFYLTYKDRGIYDGYFVDVTQRCNLSCQYCYYDKKDSLDTHINALTQDCMVNRHRAPFILTGGEPTLRKDLPQIIERLCVMAPVELLTNGTTAPENLIIPQLTTDGIAYNVNLSMHPESKGQDMAVLEHFRHRGLKIESILCVIDSIEQMDKVVALCEEYRDVILSCRIKAATELWAQGRPKTKIFVSDMLNRLGAQVVPQRNNMTSFVNVIHNGMFYMLVSWFDKWNVDLVEIDCGPYYRAQNGEVKNIVTACLINQGIREGWLYGKNIPSLV